MSKTTRSEDRAYAGDGAVNQHDAKLPIYTCNACGREVVWVTSPRTGRKYLAAVSYGYKGTRYYIGANLHRCEPVRVDVYAEDDAEAQYDDWTAAHFALDAKDRAAGRTQDADDMRDLLIARYRPSTVRCAYEASTYCPVHDHDHVLARREQDVAPGTPEWTEMALGGRPNQWTRDESDVNASWAAMKDVAAAQEREQEAAAFLADVR